MIRDACVYHIYESYEWLNKMMSNIWRKIGKSEVGDDDVRTYHAINFINNSFIFCQMQKDIKTSFSTCCLLVIVILCQ